MKKGCYIIFEGGEGCGKSTQAKLLHEYFNEEKIKNILSREPGGIKEAEQIRKILLDSKNNLDSITELFLFEAARTEFFKKKVIPNLKRKINVISDRSCYATEAYQGYAGEIKLSLIKKLNNIATQEIKPDLAFIIDVNPRKGLEKELAKDRFAKKGLIYHTKVNQGYLKIAKQNPQNFIVIPYQEGKINEMQEQIRKHIKKKLDIL
jgi:dTMP kinase